MIDNLELIKPLLNFKEDGDFYREAVPSYADSLEKTARALDNQSQLSLV